MLLLACLQELQSELRQEPYMAAAAAQQREGPSAVPQLVASHGLHQFMAWAGVHSAPHRAFATDQQTTKVI